MVAVVFQALIQYETLHFSATLLTSTGTKYTLNSNKTLDNKYHFKAIFQQNKIKSALYNATHRVNLNRQAGKMNKGTIEGFFGKMWTHFDRLAHCNFLSESGFSFYIYAPKSDPYLRRSWSSAWPEARWHELASVAEHCSQLGLDFGIGLSPFELHLNFDSAGRQKLEHKIHQINKINPNILCVLFDDMRGDVDDLAKIQVEITECILRTSNAKKIIVCPSYYSEDPVLDKVFGQRPEHYLEDLGRLLPMDVDIFWTGSKVCSASFSDYEIKGITEKLRRKPFLWDNYPVNDGEKMCNHLHLEGFNNRSNLSNSNIAGHAINPMNQPWLSQIPIATLPEMYNPEADTKKTTLDTINSLCHRDLAEIIYEDLEIFQKKGLEMISEDERNTLIEKYRNFEASPYAKEVLKWLGGDYKFDPNCLTD